MALVVKKSPASVGDERGVGSAPGLGRSPGEGHGNLLQYTGLENATDSGVCWLWSTGCKESDMTEAT